MAGWGTLMGRVRGLAGRTLGALRLEWLRHRLWRAAPGSTVTLGGLRLRITDGPNAYMQFKDEFVRHNYAFRSSVAAPVVIDGGANMGLFSLATLRDHPEARITAFEPDPAIAALLRENLAANGAAQVTVVVAALGASEGTARFARDGRAGGALGDGDLTVRVVPLSPYATQPIDFLKLNIEGAELDVLRELEQAGRLRNVRAMVIEHHGWYAAPHQLAPLLDVLGRNGFRYLVHDLDDQTNPVTKPPFVPLPAGTPWFCLVYAWQDGAR